MPDITILCILMLCLSFFPLIQYASPPVVSMDILSPSISKFATYVEFAKAQSSLTLARLHVCCSLFRVVGMKQMVQTGDLLDAVWNTHSILVFAQTNVIMEVNPRIEVML